jgi:hypothetical protein
VLEVKVGLKTLFGPADGVAVRARVVLLRRGIVGHRRVN